MWTTADTGIMINFESVRSLCVEVSDDRQFVEVQVRWASDGDRFPIATLVVQEFGDVPTAMVAAQVVVEAIRKQIISEGKYFELPALNPPHPEQ